jgi:hypothetical protein
MAEAQAGASSAPQIDPNAKADDNVDPNDPSKKAPPEKVYTQTEVDRILGKVRKNARYLGRKEAEAELLRQGATPRQAADAVDRKDDAPAEDKEPKRDEFENYEEYQRALTRFEAKKASREESTEREKKEAEKRDQEAQEKAAKSWHGKIEAAIEKHPTSKRCSRTTRRRWSWCGARR